MASVSDRDRGQLLLIGALALAVSLVGIALVLNSAIYTHNLASRYDSQSGDTITFAGDARTSAGGMIDYANEEYADQGFSTIKSEYVDGLTTIEGVVVKDAAGDGRYAEINHVSGSIEEGVYIADKESGGGQFLPRTVGVGEALDQEWVVAEDVRAREFDVTVEYSAVGSLSTGEVENILDASDPTTLSNTPWTVEFVDGSETWRVTLWEDSGLNIMSHRVGSSTYKSCSTPDSVTTIEFTDAEFDGKHCDALEFVDDLDGTYTIRYYFGGSVEGTYELFADRIVDDETSEVGPFTDAVDTINYGSHCEGPTYYAGTSSNWPRVSPAIFKTTIETTHEGPEVTYRAKHDVAPELEKPLETPRITSFDVLDSGDNDDQFTVEWDVQEPNGDAVTADIRVVEPDGDVETVSGATSPQIVTVDSDALDHEGAYEITLTVSDGNGHSRSATQRHADDGNPTDESLITGCAL